MLDFSTISIDSGFSLNTIIDLTLYLVVGIYAVFSGVLYYHWRSYSSDVKVTTYTLVTYICTTVPLILIMIGVALTL